MRDEVQNPKDPSPERLYSLDVLRGLASLAVICWHWQHFGSLYQKVEYQRDLEPLYWLLQPFYEHGWLAVDLFFCISGFVFFWLYAPTIRARTLSFRSFLSLRISRLYPLHWLTLAVVIGCQLRYRFRLQADFIYPWAGRARLTDNFFLIQGWLPGSDQTCNGPSWSVSVELFLYLLFFVTVRLLGLRRWWQCLAIAVLSTFQWGGLGYGPRFFLVRGLMGFFVGGATFDLTHRLMQGSRVKRWTRLLGSLACLGWCLAWLESYRGVLTDGAHWVAAKLPWLPGLVDGYPEWVSVRAFAFLLCPLTVAALALHNSGRPGGYQKLAWLGDISYATYLWHFPLQFGLALVAIRFHLPSSVFMTGRALLGFYAILIAVGCLSYYGFERPAQRFLRDLLVPGQRRR